MPDLITDAAALEAALSRLAPASWLALDTEFMRERTYHPQLSLVQLGTVEETLLIDPLAIADLTPLAQFLADPAHGLLVHAARQDLEALAQRGLSPAGALFDTQIAAMLLGLPDQASYAALVAHFCEVTLDKSQTRTDWSQRPLSDAQLAYAAEDVRYLPALHARLEADLLAEGKLEWLWQETSPLAAVVRHGEPPEDAWRRLKGIQALPAPMAARARALAVWRERYAQDRDVPRGWIVKDDVLFTLARTAPETTAQLAKVPGLAPATLRKHADALLECLRAMPEAEAQTPPELWRTSREGQALLVELQTLVKETGERLRVTPTLLANRRELEALILGETPPRLFEGWRRSVIGEAVAARVAAMPLAVRRMRA
jgi:ribonuclease D